jgi:hypothetical protein
MLYREALLGLGVYALYQEVGAQDLLAAMTLAAEAGSYSVEALRLVLTRPGAAVRVAPLALPGVPTQAEIDRPLSVYEALVHGDVALPAIGSGEVAS